MIKKLVVVVALLGVANIGFAQTMLAWKDFSDVTFTEEYNAAYEVYFLMPTFGELIKSHEGQEISIIGYFLDFSTGDTDMHLVSQRPMASCFFCGGSGPESIIELNFKEDPPFNTDQIVIVTGRLKLNAKDVDHCNYILEGASAVAYKR